MVRGVLAVVAGLIAGVIVVGGIEAISTHIYPLPPGFDPHDPAALTAVAADLPPGAFVGVLLAWGAGALAGAWTAARIGGRAGLGYQIGMLLGAGAIWTMLLIPHPLWLWISAAVTIPAGTLAGVKLVGGGQPSPVRG